MCVRRMGWWWVEWEVHCFRLASVRAARARGCIIISTRQSKDGLLMV